VSLARVVDLSTVFALLDDCAPGHKRTETPHYWRIEFNGLTFASLPLGDHGRGRHSGRAEIQAGKVRHMIRALQIDAKCASKHVQIQVPDATA
jgi:hypothetical protein